MESPLHIAHNARLDAMEAGVISELDRNMGELERAEAAIMEASMDMYHFWMIGNQGV